MKIRMVSVSVIIGMIISVAFNGSLSAQERVQGLTRIDSGVDDLVAFVTSNSAAQNVGQVPGGGPDFQFFLNTGVDFAGGTLNTQQSGPDGVSENHVLHGVDAIAPRNVAVAVIQLDTAALVAGATKRLGDLPISQIESRSVSNPTGDLTSSFIVEVTPPERFANRRLILEAIFDIELTGTGQLPGRCRFFKQIGGSQVTLTYSPGTNIWSINGIMMQGRGQRVINEIRNGPTVRFTDTALQRVTAGQRLNFADTTSYNLGLFMGIPNTGTEVMLWNVRNWGFARLTAN